MPINADVLCFKFGVTYIQANEKNMVNYTVLHKYERLDAGYDLESEVLKARAGRQVTPSVREKWGFDNPNRETVEVMADGSTVVTYIYTRKYFNFSITDREYIDNTSAFDGSYKYGTKLNVKALERADYLLRWDDGSTDYERVITLEDDLELTPIYEYNKYIITLNANGGEVNPSTIEVVKGQAIGVIPTPIQLGYYLDGWYTGLDAGNIVDIDYIPTCNMEIYAKWKISVEEASISNEYINIEAGRSELINITNANVIEEEYTFISNDEAIAMVDGTGKVTGVSEGITTITILGLSSGDSKTVVVDVSSASTYTIIFDANGGVGEMPNQVVQRGRNAILTKNSFIRNRYLFKGWNSKNDGTGESFFDEESILDITDENTITLYAKWEVDQFPVEFLQVGACTFNGIDGTITGSGCANYAGQKYIDTGVALYSQENINKDYELGFRIESYNSNENVMQATFMNTKLEGNGYPGAVCRKNNADISIASRKTSNANAEVKFFNEEIEKVKLFRINGEMFYSINDGEKVFLNDLTQFNPTFNLNVWFGAAPTNASATSSQRHLIGTLADMYIKLGTYSDDVARTVIFEANGGRVSPATVKVPDGAIIGALPTPERDLYDFVGWYTDLTQGVEVTPNYVLTRDVTLYARWEKRETNTISFDTNGGSVVEDIEVEKNHAIGRLPTSRKQGKILEGWYLEDTLDTPVHQYYVPTGDITVYAKWINSTFDDVFRQDGECVFNGEDGTITGNDCLNYIGQKYIDTGIALYSQENIDKDYEIGFDIVHYVPEENGFRATLFNTKLEATGYPGVVFRRSENSLRFELQSRKSIDANEVRNYKAQDVTSVKIYRINGEIFYSTNDNELEPLNNLNEYNPTFNLTAWFGAGPANASGSLAQRYLVGTLKNMYIKLGDYQEEGKHKIILDSNGGEVSSSVRIINQGSKIGTLPTPVMEGYDFMGWYTGISTGVLVNHDYIPTSDTRIFARWQVSE